MLHAKRPRFGRLAGAAIAAATIAAFASVSFSAPPSSERTLSLYNIHNKELTTVLYKRDGRFVPGALDKLNWALRDWRRDEKTNMDPALIDLLWEIHNELGSKQPIHVISSYRSRNTNEMLRNTVGGQASESRHILGKAADVHFPDVPVKRLRYSALIRERGGVGYYPTSAIPFVHIDTDRVRAWPRLPRYELALLFPSGNTRHLPAEGGPLTADDTRQARTQHRDLAQQIAEFHSIRANPQAGRTILASAEPMSPPPPNAVVAALAPALAPQLLEAPRVVDRPSRLTNPSSSERKKLSELVLAAVNEPPPKLTSEPKLAVRRPAAPATIASDPPPQAQKPTSIAALLQQTIGDLASSFVPAPAFDEEHPEELSYRPFPIAPLLTATSSADDPALAAMHHPDLARALELIDTDQGVPPMRLRPPQQLAALMLSQEFKGEAINLVALHEQRHQGSAVETRRVSTTDR